MNNYLLTIRKNKGKIILQSLIIISFIFYLLNVFNKVTGYCRRQVEFYTFCSFPFYISAEKMLFRFFIR